MTLISRKAILIGCPGSGKSFLSGVEHDLQNMKRFLLSNRGGQWYTNEISVLNNPDPQRILSLAFQTQADYLLVYFSGHGYTEQHSGIRKLCCNGGNIADESLIQGPAKRILVINDVCRTFIGAGIGRIDADDVEYDSFTGPVNFRLLFDNAIQSTAHTKIIIHGTQPGLIAADTQSGGAFTQGLLKVCNRINSKGDPCVLSIGQMLEHVPNVLKTKGNTQIPYIYYYGSSHILPFGIAMPSVPKSRRPVQQTPSKENSNELAVALGILLLAVFIANS